MDELDAYMQQNDDQIKKDLLKKLSSDVIVVNKDIEKYTKLISLVAPTSFMSHKAQHSTIE